SNTKEQIWKPGIQELNRVGSVFSWLPGFQIHLVTMTSQVPTRVEIPESDKWDLTHLFADVGKWQEDFAWVERNYSQIKNWKGKIGASAKNLAECLEFE